MARIHKLALLILLVPFGFASIVHASSAIISQTPVNGALDIETTSAIGVVFDRTISAVSSNIDLSPSTEFSFTVSEDTLTITPTTELASNTTYTLTLAGIQDADGNVLSSYTSQFTTQNNYSISIYNNANGGLNLISIPVQPTNIAIASVLDTAASSIDSVWSYDPSNPSADSSGWLVYYPAHPELSNLSTMGTGYGYWVTANANTSLSGSGSLFTSTTTPPSRAVQPGWNLLGYYQLPGQNSSNATDAFSSIPNFTTLVGYDNATGVFKAVSSILPGDAFWLGIPSSGTYYPSYSFSSGDGGGSFGPSSPTVLTVSASADTPVAGIVIVDNTSDTNDISLLKGTLVLDGSFDVVLNELPVTFTVTGATDVDAITGSVTLKIGDNVYTETVNTSSASETVTFDNLAFNIIAGDTVNFEVLADINDIEANVFDEGDTLLASVTASNREMIGAENEIGDQLVTDEKSGTATGEAQELRMGGIMLTLVSTAASVSSGTDANDDLGTFTIRFRVTAVGDTAYVSSLADATLSGVSEGKTSVNVDRAGTAVVEGTSVVLNNTTDTSLTSVGNYLIEDGSSETFELTTTVQLPAAGSAGLFRVVLGGVSWSTSDVYPVASTYTSNLDTFKTSYMGLN